jgi:hypothetical protein
MFLAAILLVGIPLVVCNFHSINLGLTRGFYCLIIDAGAMLESHIRIDSTSRDRMLGGGVSID